MRPELRIDPISVPDLFGPLNAWTKSAVVKLFAGKSDEYWSDAPYAATGTLKLNVIDVVGVPSVVPQMPKPLPGIFAVPAGPGKLPQFRKAPPGPETPVLGVMVTPLAVKIGMILLG